MSLPRGICAGRQRGASLLDPITFEVIRHRLWAINDEQARMAARLSGSPIVYDAFDFNAALVTPDGQGLYTGVYIMHHGATIDEFVGRVLARLGSRAEIREGDMFFTNDPWWGALHANDGILAAPIFREGRLVLWSAIVMHDNDVGGPVPGSFVTGRARALRRGAALPGDQDRGGLRATARPRATVPAQQPDAGAERPQHARPRRCAPRDAAADPRADRAVRPRGVHGGARGDPRLRRAARCGADCARFPMGAGSPRASTTTTASRTSSTGSAVASTSTATSLVFDMTGTSTAGARGRSTARDRHSMPRCSASFSASSATTSPGRSAGVRKVVEIVSEEGTLNNAVSPAATSMASIMATLSTQDVVAAATAKMLLTSERYRSEAQATWTPGICTGSFAGVNPDGDYTVTPIGNSFGGGGGARTFTDGIDSGGCLHSMGSRIPNTETVESRSPILQLFRRELRDGGGPGRFRGGAGIEFGCIPHKARGEAVLNTLASGVRMPGGLGLSGGAPGAAVSNVVLRDSNVSELFAAGIIPVSVRRWQRGRGRRARGEGADDAERDDCSRASSEAVPASAIRCGVSRRSWRETCVTVLSRTTWRRSVYGVVLRDGVVDETATTVRREAHPSAAARGGASLRRHGCGRTSRWRRDPPPGRRHDRGRRRRGLAIAPLLGLSPPLRATTERTTSEARSSESCRSLPSAR